MMMTSVSYRQAGFENYTSKTTINQIAWCLQPHATAGNDSADGWLISV